jgi:hypothetical protein
VASCSRAPSPPDHRTFESPEHAVRALDAAVKRSDVQEVVAIFGSDGKELVDSSDPATARRNREVFSVALAEGWRLVDHEGGGKMLIVGKESWPFPVPLVKEAAGWRFDTAAGKEEVLARRIGRNELKAIQVCHAYVAAQRRYASRAHDGRPAGLYARRFSSDPGKQNGLYWPRVRGEGHSPLGDLMPQAEEHAAARAGHDAPAPFHGYYFRILTSQGSGAPGGPSDYIVNGELSAGFALVAWPAQYDRTGIMTFIVNHDGIVHEKDLGENDSAARTVTLYNPDASWGVAKASH